MSGEAINIEGGDEVTRTFLAFMNSYSSEEGENGDGGGGMAASEDGSPYRDYVEQLKSMYDRIGTTLYVDFQHLVE
jgi:hypothetical protein